MFHQVNNFINALNFFIVFNFDMIELFKLILKILDIRIRMWVFITNQFFVVVPLFLTIQDSHYFLEQWHFYIITQKPSE